MADGGFRHQPSALTRSVYCGLRPVVAVSSRNVRRNASAAGGAVALFSKSTSRMAVEPYAPVFASLSGRSTPPERLMPANTPFAREYARISAVSFPSVLAEAARPTGTAATD